mgnify:FL=1
MSSISLGAVMSVNTQATTSPTSYVQTAQNGVSARQGSNTPNPDRTVDPQLNMVVTRYYAPGGVLVAQSPSEAAIRQYLLYGRTADI